jgi:hypothetical protein
LRKLEFIEERLHFTRHKVFFHISHMACDHHRCIRTSKIVKGPKDSSLSLLNDCTDTSQGKNREHMVANVDGGDKWMLNTHLILPHPES